MSIVTFFCLQSDCFYNAGWTADMREVVSFLHQEYPKAPLFTVGTSIGANIVVGLVFLSRSHPVKKLRQLFLIV
jgi:predicted alpha/beta-fold hydrolase